MKGFLIKLFVLAIFINILITWTLHYEIIQQDKKVVEWAKDYVNNQCPVAKQFYFGINDTLNGLPDFIDNKSFEDIKKWS